MSDCARRLNIGIEREGSMNTRLLLKLLFILAVLLFMVMMGVSNDASVEFEVLGKSFGEMRAAFMYFIFFGAGVLFGAVIAVGWRGFGKS